MELSDFVSRTGGLLSSNDYTTAYLDPYYYQADTQLGWPDTSNLDANFEDLLLYWGEEPASEVDEAGSDEE